MESQKTLEDLTRQMDESMAQFELLKPALRALGDVELLVSFDDLRARFAPPRAPLASTVFNAVRG